MKRWVLVLGSMLTFQAASSSALAQAFGPIGPVMRVTPGPRGTYGPRMSFGEFGYRMNVGPAFGSPYGGLGALGNGFGSGVVPPHGPGVPILYGSAYVSPGRNMFNTGYEPPLAVYGPSGPNPAIFPAPGPNHRSAPPTPAWPGR